jgi:SAM-dependent methyltransferase
VVKHFTDTFYSPEALKLSHYQQRKFIECTKEVFPEYFKNTEVLEVGSWDRNGSSRYLFENCKYTGADIAEGPGVDLVCAGQDVDFPDQSIDMTYSAECFEHNPQWKESFQNMWRMLKPGGLCVVTCATTGRLEHGTSRTTPQDSLTALENLPDYYMNLTHKDFEDAFKLEEMFQNFGFYYNAFSKDLYFTGIKVGECPITDLDQRFGKLKELAGNITTEKGASALKSLERKISWNIKRLIVPIIGEKRFQDYRVKSRLH